MLLVLVVAFTASCLLLAALTTSVAYQHLTQTFVSGTTKEPKPHPLPFGRFASFDSRAGRC
ncbi:MAG TPA: hypothetical protein VF800_22550, partial [Telluria sp.]